ncbi:hypothetical protein M011DRAFT_318559 [Sporormia fimetaria CBS 119925]|uniref:Rhodopsin domain-containing protein n=1 Tax=Sporormia fimetaria CBS 119925 TaxID=1340428 RepID=A0A6A6UV57_9PLEO|nr:hypothetical protein M011DRAFT_318559 [Sporormia fimetaria CBS 119925]
MMANGHLVARAGGLHPPPSVVLSWPRPNHVNPETRGSAAPYTLIILLVLTLIVYTARMWARLVVAKNAGLDDALMSVAMILVVGSTIAVVLGISQYGFQWHAWDQTKETLVTTRQITLAIELLYLAATTLIKISILCFYRRLASGSLSKTFLYCVQCSITVFALHGIAFSFVIMFSYSPIEGFWRIYDVAWRAENRMTSLDEGAIIIAVTVLGTIHDIIVCALPIILVWNLRINRRQKTGLTIIFGAGVLCCICGAMRTYYAIYVYHYTYDITWWAFHGWIWTALEADLGIICASAPALKVFFRRYFNHGIGGSSLREKTWYGRAKSSIKVQDDGENIDETPLNRIIVSHSHHVTSQTREEIWSDGSYASTKAFNGLPRRDKF